MPVADRRTFYFTDRIVIGYSLFMVCVLAFVGRPLADYLDELVFYSVTALAAWLIARHIDESRSGVHRFFRLLYPAMVLPLFYRMTGGTMFLLSDRFLDAQLITFEKWLFGVDISMFIDHHLLNVPATEFLSLCYWLYYPLIPVFLIWLFIRGDYSIIRGSMAAITLTFVVGYTMFFLYPIEGPRWFYAGRFLHEIEGPVFRQMVNFMIDNGAVRGGCMPSTHFAVTLVITMFLGRHYPKWLWLMIPLSVGLGLGTVWGRFHYLSDVIVGGLIGLTATAIVWRVAPAPRVKEKIIPCQKEAFPHHAS